MNELSAAYRAGLEAMGARPSGECFYYSLQFFSRFRIDDPILDQYRLIHAIVLNPLADDEQRIGHAWVEHEDVAYEAVRVGWGIVYSAMNRETYRATMRVQEFTAYTLAEALAENDRTNHFGPWIVRYQECCTPGRCAGCGTALPIPIQIPASDFCTECQRNRRPPIRLL